MADIDQNVRYLQDGEAVDSEVLNRPIKDLSLELDQKFTESNNEAQSDAIVFAIALGG